MSLKERIYLTAKANVGETAWAKEKDRVARRNNLVHFREGEWKCNLFVYEVLLAAGCDIGTPNRYPHPSMRRYGVGALMYVEDKTPKDNHRPPCCIDWYNLKVNVAEYIGEGYEGRQNCEEGDIITDGNHIGIIASYDEDSDSGESFNATRVEVVLDGFGFGSGAIGEKRPVRIFRCI